MLGAGGGGGKGREARGASRGQARVGGGPEALVRRDCSAARWLRLGGAWPRESHPGLGRVINWKRGAPFMEQERYLGLEGPGVRRDVRLRVELLFRGVKGQLGNTPAWGV